MRPKISGEKRAVVGRTISHYQIVEKLGEGGMGVVWKARDTRLKRAVVLKFIKHQFSERFEREARAIAALNHPHICTLYDVGQHEGEPYLVMEHVEGKPLKGPLPLNRVLQAAGQIADALAAAHARGIVHRDLKPSNVLVDAKGNAKVLDFGLAKLVEGTLEEGAETRTLKAATEEGAIVGTVAYMSPEQAQGKPVDSRSDIFSFGSVLYEMVTGRPAFRGDSKITILAAILDREPEPVAGVAPEELEKLIRKCLRKDPERRFQHMDDVRTVLDDLKEEGESGKAGAAPVPATTQRPAAVPSWRRFLRPALAAAGIALAGAAAAWFALRLQTRSVPQLQFVVLPEAGQQLPLTPYPQAIAVPPDGSGFVYVAASGGKTSLRRRAMDSVSDREIPGTEGASQPFFSPDGAWLGFVRGTELLKAPIVGGPPITVLKIQESFLGLGWGDDGFIYFGRRPRPGILRVSENGGSPKEVTEGGVAGPTDEFYQMAPEPLPGGRWLIFTVLSASGQNPRLYLQDLKSGKRELLLQGAGQARYIRTGHLIYGQSRGLSIARFDLRTGRFVGRPAHLVEKIRPPARWELLHFAAGRSGLLVHVPGAAMPPTHRLIWVDRQGKTQPLVDLAGYCYGLRLSPDGRRVAYTQDRETSQVWILNLQSGATTRLTHEGINYRPIWAPDGRRVAYRSHRSLGGIALFSIRSDGSGDEQELISSRFDKNAFDWTSDGKGLVFGQDSGPPTGFDVFLLSTGGDRQVHPLLHTNAEEYEPALSHGQKWLAYVSSETGRPEVYVTQFPTPGPKWQISVEGGEAPAWSADDRELFFQAGSKMMVAEVAGSGDPAPSRPRILFELGAPSVPNQAILPYGRDYDVARDGRFVMTQDVVSDEGVVPMIVTLNWRAPK